MATTVDGIAIRLGADPTGLQQGIRRAESAIDSFGSRAKAVIGRMGAAIKGTADRALTPMTSLLLGGGVAVAASRFGDFSEELMYYGMVAKKSKEGIAALRSEIHGLAKQTGIDQQVILGGINKIAEITGDTQFAEGMAGMLAKTSKATKTDLADLATVASTMRVQWGWNEQAIAEAFNTLIVQGDAGSYTLQNLAGEGKALLSSANAFGIKTKGQFESFGAFLQIMNSSIKSEAEVTTSMSALMNELISKSKDLGKLGVRVFDMKDGKAQVRDFETIMMELMKATNADISVISPMFGDEAKKALKPLMEEYQRGWSNYRKIRDSALGSGTSEIDSRFAKTADDFNTNISKMKAAALEFADTHMAGPIERLTFAMKYLNEHQKLVEYGFKAMAAAAAALVAVKVASWGMEVAKFGKELFDLAKGKKGGAGGAIGDVVDGIGVQKVYVVNMPGGGLPGVGDLPGLPGGAKGAPAAAPKAAGWFSRMFPNFAKGLNFVKSNLLSLGGIFALGAAKVGGLAATIGAGVAGLAVATVPLWGVIAGAVVAFTGLLAILGTFIDLQIERNAAEKRIVDMQKANNETIYSRYGEEAAGLMAQSQDIDREIAMEESSFFPDQEKIDNLLVHKSNLDSMYRDAVKQSIARRKDSVVGQDTPINNEFKIFVDPAKQTAVVEQVSGPVNGKFKASTKPWAGRIQ